jgi:site-specific recombinase XerD
MRQDADFTKNMLQFLKYQSVSCKASTLRSYQTGLKAFARFIQKQNLKLEKLCTNDLSDFLCELNEQNLVAYTKLNYFLIVRKYLAWEIENNQNPYCI